MRRVQKSMMVQTMSWIVLSLFFLLPSATLFASEVKDNVSHLSQDEFINWVNDDSSELVIIDVRTPDEYSSGYIKGAINIPHDEILNNISLLDPYQGKAIVFYCHSGVRVRKVTDYLQDVSYSSAELHHLQGDISAWRSNNLSLEK